MQPCRQHARSLVVAGVPWSRSVSRLPGRNGPLDVTQARGWTTIENGVAADCEPRLSVETRLNENVPAVVDVRAMRVPLLKR